jgi:hypothetical protein
VNELRLSKSQVVCGIDERIEHYEILFEKADFKQNSSSFTNSPSSDFNWQAKLDEEHLLESELLWSIDQCEKGQDSYSDRRLLTRLETRRLSKKIIEIPNEDDDVIYFLPTGKIWVGEKHNP